MKQIPIPIADGRKEIATRNELRHQFAIMKLSLFFGRCQCWRVYSRSCSSHVLDRKTIQAALTIATLDQPELDMATIEHDLFRADDIELLAMVRQVAGKTLFNHLRPGALKINRVPRTFAV